MNLEHELLGADAVEHDLGGHHVSKTAKNNQNVLRMDVDGGESSSKVSVEQHEQHTDSRLKEIIQNQKSADVKEFNNLCQSASVNFRSINHSLQYFTDVIPEATHPRRHGGGAHEHRRTLPISKSDGVRVSSCMSDNKRDLQFQRSFPTDQYRTQPAPKLLRDITVGDRRSNYDIIHAERDALSMESSILYATYI